MTRPQYFVIALAVLLCASSSQAFVVPSLPHYQTTSFSTTTQRSVASKDSILTDNVDEQQIQSDYQLSRGDGSTGGGGLPMPRQMDDDDGLKRPKVGAEMPNGRPSWFRVPAPSQAEDSRYAQVKASLKDLSLNTVCEEAQCPNIGECWNGGTGTIMLLGDTCTRGCMFCAVNTAAAPPPPDPFEPFKVSNHIYTYIHTYIHTYILHSLFVHEMACAQSYHFSLSFFTSRRKRLQKLSPNGESITLS